MTWGNRGVGRWWNSLYWRVGASFVAFVVALILAQSAIFIFWAERPGRGNPRLEQLRAAMAIAADVSRALTQDPDTDLTALLRNRAGGRPVYVVLRNGTIASATDLPLSDAAQRTAALMLRGEAPRTDEELSFGGPSAIAPIQVGRELQGFAIIAPPPSAGVFREFTRVLTLPMFLFLLALTAVAAWAIVTPVRRRLAGLEAAAKRVEAGDLAARAPDDGLDEVAQVAHAFNRMGAELAVRDAALQEADQARRRLLADVSHELKTPLTAMRGYLETIQMDGNGLDEERRRRYLGTVADETRRLDRIVADLVDLARVEHDGVRFEPQVFAPARIFERVLRRHEHAADARGIRFAAGVEPGADQLHGDPHRLEQVVENLVANALRYVPDGGTIALSAWAADGAAHLSVVDDGPGIPPEHVAHVFDRFYKADAARVAGGAGSGLGLSIVKAIVERHGGTIAVTSRPGETAFRITLPGGAINVEGTQSANL